MQGLQASHVVCRSLGKRQHVPTVKCLDSTSAAPAGFSDYQACPPAAATRQLALDCPCGKRLRMVMKSSH